MKRLYEKNAVRHSLAWLAIYLVMNTITGNLQSASPSNSSWIGAIPNFLLAAICFIYLKKTGIAKAIGLLAKPTEKASVMLYYIPVLALPFFNLIYGIDSSVSAVEALSLLTMYIGVGFMEEIIFRGLMFKALEKKWNRYLVVAFISLTFAIGHIVSMVAVGQSGSDTVLQILNAFSVGFMFMAVMLASGNLRLCVIAHVLYNFLAGISLIDATHGEIIVLNTVVTVLYFVYLALRAKNVKAYFRGVKPN